MNEVKNVSVKDIAPSSIGNIRADLGDLSELTKSIKKSGVLQPLTVRPNKNGDGGAPFEIVFGHRRLAAAIAAKLAEVPVIVRELEEDKVLELQLVENIQREDIHPLDEALAFERLRDSYGYSVEKIVAETGKSKAYIYAALKLTALGDYASAKFRKGDFDASVALYVARLPEDFQKEAADKVSTPRYKGGDKPSAREAFNIVEEVKKKVEHAAAWEKMKAFAEKENLKILSKKEAEATFDRGYVISEANYLDSAAKDYHDPEMRTFEQIVKKDLPEIIYGQDPETLQGFRLFSKKGFAESCKRLYGSADGYKPKSGGSERDHKAAVKAAKERKFRDLALPLVTEKATKGSNANFLKALLALFVERVTFIQYKNALIKPYEGRDEQKYKGTIATFNERELKDELIVLAITNSSPEEFNHVCKLLKVSPSKLLKLKKDIDAEYKEREAKRVEREKAKAEREAAAAKKAEAKSDVPINKKTGKPRVAKKGKKGASKKKS